MKIMRKIGDVVTPRDYPQFKSKIDKIGKDLNGENLYILKNGCQYIESELQPKNYKK